MTTTSAGRRTGPTRPRCRPTPRSTASTGVGIDGVHAAVALQHRFVAAAPWFGRFTLYNNAVCGDWPVRPQPPWLPITAAGAPPIVVIGSTGDPFHPLRRRGPPRA